MEAQRIHWKNMPVEKLNAHNREFLEYCMCESLYRVCLSLIQQQRKKIKKVATAFVNVRELCQNLFKGCIFRVGYNLVNLFHIMHSSQRAAKDTVLAKVYTSPENLDGLLTKMIFSCCKLLPPPQQLLTQMTVNETG